MKGDRNKEIQILPFLSLRGYLPPQENQISIGYGSAPSKGEVVGGGEGKKVLEEVVSAFCSSPLLAPAWRAVKNHPSLFPHELFTLPYILGKIVETNRLPFASWYQTWYQFYGRE